MPKQTTHNKHLERNMKPKGECHISYDKR